MGIFSRIAGFFGHGDEDALSIPPMDGVLKPNRLLDEAERILELPQLDNLAMAGGQLFCSSGNTLFRIDGEQARAEPAHTFEGNVTMVAASASGTLAVGVEGRGVEVNADGKWKRFDLGDGNGCATAGTFRADGDLIVTVGSRRHAWSDWKRDLMSRGTSGVVAALNVETGETKVLAGDLAFPYGVAVSSEGSIVVSESWRHRLVQIPPAGAGSRVGVLLDELPAYLARIAPADGGGFWLALFAPRRQLTELVLREDDYRLEMMATIPPESWVGPDFSDRADGDQPLQAGSVRQMGIMKPWAPSRSYGLVVRLDERLQPVASYHSRADGQMHGIASVQDMGGHVYVASRGAGVLLRLAGVSA